MTRETEESHNRHYCSQGQPPLGVPPSPVPVLPPHQGEQGYWMVPLPPTSGALPGQPTQWAPVIAYGGGTYSQQASVSPPPSPVHPEWTALANEEPIPIDEPILSLPLSPPTVGPLPPVEWQVMGDDPDQGREYTLLPPLPATASDSVVENQEQVLTGLGQGVGWFDVPIPAPPGNENDVPSGGPSAPGSLSGGEELRAKS